LLRVRQLPPSFGFYAMLWIVLLLVAFAVLSFAHLYQIINTRLPDDTASGDGLVIPQDPP
jgi:hypothetical protein